MSTNPKDAIGVKKAPLALVPPAAIIAISDALADGAKKYGPQNWRLNDGVKATLYVAAAMRHIFAWVDGEENAEDSGVHHLAHAAACMAILLDARELGQMIDDRPTPGPAAAMLKARDKSKAPVRFKVGDRVRVIANDSAHKFEIGLVVTVTEAETDWLPHECQSITCEDGDDYWYLTSLEVAPAN